MGNANHDGCCRFCRCLWCAEKSLGIVKLLANPCAAGCTPSYINREFERDLLPQEQQMAGAKFAPWPYGFANFVDTLEEWRAKGDLKGMQITAAA